jgi:hypothetical protein
MPQPFVYRNGLEIKTGFEQLCDGRQRPVVLGGDGLQKELGS